MSLPFSLRCLFVLGPVFALFCGVGEAQSLGVRQELVFRTAPKLSSELASESVVRVGDVVRFRVQVDDADDDRVSLRLRDPLPGMVLAPVRNATTPFEREVVWVVSPVTGGLVHVTLEARDATGKTTLLRRSVHVLGGTERSSIATGDVTGDGRADVVAVASSADAGGVGNSGALYVWSGSDLTRSTGAPQATLLAEAAAQGDTLGQLGIPSPGGQALQLADVTGDGIEDVVCVASLADVDGVRDCGAVYVWAGGPGLSGTQTSSARLRLFGARPFDLLGEAAGQALMLADVTGDGVRDVIVVAALADGPGSGGLNRGAAYVWAGGPSMIGKVGPDVVLSPGGLGAFDAFGSATEQGLRLVDLDADGVLDLVAAVPTADAGGGVGNGAVFVWYGGASLQAAPDAVLTDVPALAIGEQELAFVDVTGDGRLDVLATASDRVLVFDLPLPRAQGTLLATARLGPLIGTPGLGSGPGLSFADVNGDGTTDVLVSAEDASAPGTANTGVVYFWNGGPFSGIHIPDAYLLVPGAVAGDRLGFVDSRAGRGLRLADVTGDGIVDVLAAASEADVSGVVDAGALYLFAGGALSGAVAPDGVLSAPDPVAGDRLGAGGDGQRILIDDVSGDGIADVVAAAQAADVDGILDAGAVYVWTGGAALIGSPGLRPASATLTRQEPLAFDELSGASGQGLELVDLTGDGIRDVVVAAVEAEAARGAVAVFAGGAGIAGRVVPSVECHVEDGTPGERLGETSGESLLFQDRTADGLLDLWVAAANGLPSPTTGIPAGAVYVFAGGAPGAQDEGGVREELLRLEALGSDRLGDASGQAIRLVDLTGDGREDLLAGAQFTDMLGVRDTGALYVWDGRGAFLPLMTLWVMGAASNDRLGQ